MGFNDSLLYYVYNSFNNNNYVLVKFYDLKKAFDTINHKYYFLNCMERDLGKKTLKLLKNYFSNRKQCCVINGQKSDFLDINCGVPQGSTLCVSGGGDIYDLNSIMNTTASEFLTLCLLNRLTVNLTKSKEMVFSTKRISTLNIQKLYTTIPRCMCCILFRNEL